MPAGAFGSTSASGGSAGSVAAPPPSNTGYYDDDGWHEFSDQNHKTTFISLFHKISHRTLTVVKPFCPE